MCGIAGVIGSQDVVEVLSNAIQSLEYRGYDSSGIGMVQAGELAVRKNVGGVAEVAKLESFSQLEGLVGIAHTRWATHGKVSRANAHPHMSNDQQFAVVHNGIIDNYHQLRQALQAKGVCFASSTDSEVAVALIAEEYRACGQVQQAFLQASRQLQGSYALCMVSTLDPKTIYCLRHGSPIVLGRSKERMFVASDVNAFLAYTREALVLEDGECAILSATEVSVMRLVDCREVPLRPLHIEWEPETSRKGGYTHYMLKEIFDQPQTVKTALATPQEGVEQIATCILNAKNSYLMGVGTTHYVGMMGQYFFSRYSAKTVHAFSSDEFPELAVVTKDDLVVCLSQSGETFDTRKALEYAKAAGAKTAGIINVMGSSLSYMADEVILQGSGPEICVVSTKAALAQMVILLRIALEMGVQVGHLTQQDYQQAQAEMQKLPKQIETALNELSGFVRNLSKICIQHQNWLVLGRGLYLPIALEAALKTKEITYLHVEGMPAGFLKHGALALIDPHVLSFFLMPHPEDARLHQQTLASIEEVRVRGGPVVGFVFEGDDVANRLFDECVVLPKISVLTAPFLHLVVAQLLSYFSALQLNRNIDKPRNLAKSITVG